MKKPADSPVPEKELVSRILQSTNSGDVIPTTLRTDQRVLARVTDGIYRQPASALRELVLNAYDADATRVVIRTDAPRFGRIVVEDDGRGMDAATLAHLLYHIGGSAKRNEIGQTLGVASDSDAFRSPGGRQLIGKIGIGLFSVSQLSHSFDIVTKVKGEKFRIVASVALRQYSEEPSADSRTADGDFEAGRVNVWREAASDVDAHGTSIFLTDIRPQARDTLRSRAVWSAIEQSERTTGEDETTVLEPPKYHVGRVGEDGGLLTRTHGRLDNLPWTDEDDPTGAFKKLVDSVWNEVYESNPNPRLDSLFDYYLRMIWQLSLSVPLPYLEGHPFDLTLDELQAAFEVSNVSRGSAVRLAGKTDAAVRGLLDLADGRIAGSTFEVFFDNLRLARPIRHRRLLSTANTLKKPLLFLGRCREEFAAVPRELSGGTLSFEAYLLWTPKVVPTEHQGVLVRIHGASGTLFDSTFLRYQVSEQTRLRQITCEVFVTEGLDAALNIDREAFNNAHPHYVYLTKWIHSALRQLATAQKRLAAEERAHMRGESQEAAVHGVQRVAKSVWQAEMDDESSQPPTILLTDEVSLADRRLDQYVFTRDTVLGDVRKGRRTASADVRARVQEEKLKAIVQVLASFGLLEGLTRKRQERLLKAIYAVLESPES